MCLLQRLVSSGCYEQVCTDGSGRGEGRVYNELDIEKGVCTEGVEEAVGVSRESRYSGDGYTYGRTMSDGRG